MLDMIEFRISDVWQGLTILGVLALALSTCESLESDAIRNSPDERGMLSIPPNLLTQAREETNNISIYRHLAKT